ncbi:hypothetical protein BSL78_04008 [Apostichopus japonicus]|uniref:CCHC-type domain-containing protein n=1 Tax=Stichopus japonicus TaxID=307972 RepID=A0A2G8LFN3_STIJA|nr:hypothetical protein BSL78_04008 [Apostichopus japonicus]
MGNYHPRRTRGAAGTCRNGFGSVRGCQGCQNVLLCTSPWGVERAPTGSDRPETGHSLLPVYSRAKAHVRYPGQPRTCFRCGETGHEAKGCPNKKCGRCLRLGHDSTACPNEVVCSLCGKEGHVFRACPSSYVSRTKSGDPNPVPAPRKSPPASPINSSSSVPSPPPVSPDPEALSDGESVVIDSPEVLSDGDSGDSVVIGSPEALSDSDSGGSVIVEPKRATGTSWYDEMGEPSLKRSASSDDSDDDMSSRARLKLTESSSA